MQLVTQPVTTKNLILRPVEERDVRFIQAHFSSWGVIQFMRPPVPNPYPPDGARQFVTNVLLPNMRKGIQVAFIIELKDGTPIGSVGSQLDDAAARIWHRGFWLAPDFREQGFMKEASLAALRWTFENTDATEVISENAPLNKASAHISSVQEFEPNGIGPIDPPYHNGEAQSELWRMTRKNFYRIHGE